MSGIIFNGIMWNPEKENKEEYINRVINNKVNETINNSVNNHDVNINDAEVKRIETDSEDTDDYNISDSELSTDDETDTDTDEENEYNELFIKCLNDIKKECMRGGFVIINSCKLFMNIQEQYFIKKSMFYEKYKDVKNNKYKIGDVVKTEHKHLKHFNFYEVIKIEKNRIKCKALHPVLLIKHAGDHDAVRIEGGTGTADIYKYSKGVYSEYLKTMFFNKTKFNKVYVFDDYIFSIVN